MTGAILTLLGTGGAGSGTTTPAATSWAAIYGTDAAFNSPITLTGFTGTVAITAALSGGGVLHYVLDGVTNFYAGAFNVVAGQALSWGVSVGHTGHAGTLTVTNFTNSSVMQAFSYSVESSFGQGGYR